MTPTEIQNLSGVELAAEVGRRIMRIEFGQAELGSSGVFGWYSVCDGSRHFPPHFRPDRDGNDILEVIGQMQALHFCVSISDTDSGFVCRFWKTSIDEYAGEDKDLPVAVCRAALQAVAAKEEK